jgi:hypothetical protein
MAQGVSEEDNPLAMYVADTVLDSFVVMATRVPMTTAKIRDLLLDVQDTSKREHFLALLLATAIQQLAADKRGE